MPQELAELLLEDKLAGASLLIFANKQDLAGALPVERVAQVGRLLTMSSQIRAGTQDIRHYLAVRCPPSHRSRHPL